ncbi:MAG: hypothetical protein QM626_02560 [Microbacterium sp.]|uniref:hypothetical protein n=1 Tax=Microbacterium sp. TaxID=51671 RepID=UPI0039E5AF2B
MHWADEAAEQLEKLLHDPMAAAVRGTVEITAISAPAPRGRYQEASVELRAWAPGVAPVTVRTTVVLPARDWPVVGTRLPAAIPPAEPAELEVDWSRLAG